MKIFFKQLFCRHIYQQIGKIENRVYDIDWSAGGMIDIDAYKEYIVKKRCVKCRKIHYSYQNELHN